MFKIQIKQNVFDPKIDTYEFTYIPELTIWDYFIREDNSDFDTFFNTFVANNNILLKTGVIKFLLNLELIDPPESIKLIVPNDGDVLTILIHPKVPFIATVLIGLVLSIATSYVSYLLMPKPDPPITSNESEIPNSTTYTWEGPTTSYALGRPVPIIYGEHSTGGSFINAMVEGLPYGHGQSWQKGEAFCPLSDPCEGRRSTYGRRLPGAYTYFDKFDDERMWLYSGMGGYWDDKRPKGTGAYFSNLFPNPTQIDNPQKLLSDSNTDSIIDPLWVEAIRGQCFGNQNSVFEQQYIHEGGAGGHWLHAWKWFMRFVSWDLETNTVSIIDTDNAEDPVTHLGTGWASPWKKILPGTDPTFAEFEVHFFNGDNWPLPSSFVTPEFKADPGMQAMFPQTTALPVNTQIWIELWLEGVIAFANVAGGTNDDEYLTVWTGCRPRITNVEYLTYGLVDKAESDADKTYSTADGLRMLLAVSEGEVCSIANLDTVNVSRNFHEDIELRINDTPAKDLFEFPDVQGFVAPLEIQASRGANHTIIKYPQGQDSYVNLFNKRQTNLTRFDWQVEQYLRIPHFTFETSTACSEIDIEFNFYKGLYKFNSEEGDFSPSTVMFFISYYPADVADGAATQEEADALILAATKYWTAEGERDSGYRIVNGEGTTLNPESTFGDTVPFILKDHRTNPFKLQVRLGSDITPLLANKYHITIWRHTVPYEGQSGPTEREQKIYIYDTFKVESICEYSFEMLRYPNTALLGLRLLPTDKLSGSAPKINFQVEGKYIKTPLLRRANNTLALFQNAYTVYDENTGVYTWKELNSTKPTEDDEELSLSTEETALQFTNNPALILYDLLTTQDLYPSLPESYLVWQDYITASAFCWEMINTTFIEEKQERRFECNLVIDGESDAATILNHLCTIYRLKLVWVGNKLRLRILQPEYPVQKFTDASILPKSYQESYQPYGKIPNTLDISFYDETEYYKQSVIQVSTKDAEAYKQKIVKQSYSILGTTKLSQALRIAQYLLASVQLTDKVIQFKTTLKGLACLPGDVIRIQSNTMSYGYSGFLRSNPVAGTYYLDRELYLSASKSGNYRFEVQKRSTREYGQADVVFAVGSAPHTFSSISGVTLLTALGDPITVSEGDEWQLYPQSGAGVTYTKEVRIAEITTDVEKNECTITAEPYLPSIYTEDPLALITPYLPPPPPVVEVQPPDVVDLALTQISDTYNVRVTYTVPSGSSILYFLGRISSFITTTNQYITIYFANTPNMSQLTELYPLKITSSTGIVKGNADIVSINKTAEYVRIDYGIADTITLEVGDTVTQERVIDVYQAIAHTNIFFSENGTSFNLHGQDFSKGAGYLINLSESYVGRTVWVKVQAVGIYGALSPNPPTTSIRITVDRCLPSPSHLSMCSVGDGQATFTGCDVCISWEEVSSFQGAGMGEDAEALDRADTTGDFRITGHTIWIYNNAIPSSPALLRSLVGYTNTTYDYNHNMNKEDQYRYSGIEGSGYRDLRFEVYQEDTYGNVSCNPAVIELSNAAPSMSGYTPWYSAGELTISLDWSGFINNSELMPEDVEGWEVWYGTTVSDLTVINVPDRTQGNVKITGIPSGTYIVFIVPYDCFGAGLPRDTYRSEIVYPVVTGTTLPSYVPAKPEGMAAGITILTATDLGTHYEIVTEDSLELFGFDNTVTSEGDYATSTFVTNYIYYNSNPNLDPDTYCYVTASSLNTQNLITAIWWNTGASQWHIKILKPLVDTLTSYGYVAGDGAPQVGQHLSINVWAELSYEEGGGIWGGGLGSTMHTRWFAPNLNSVVDRLSHFNFRVINNDTGNTSKEYIVQVDKDLADNGYYTNSVENLPAVDSTLSLSLSLVSNTGDSGESLAVGPIYVIKETLSDVPPVDATYTAVADPEGRNIQFRINNWEAIWNEGRVKHFEFFVSPGYYTFATSTWSAPTYMNSLIDGTYIAKPYEEEEYPDESTHTKLRSKMSTDGTNTFLHADVGASDSPVFQWTNEVCTDAGGFCTYDNGTTCTEGFTDQYHLNDCPYGFSSNGVTTCTYVSEGGCSRTVDTIDYNIYYVAVAVRHKTGMLQFLTYTDPDGIPTADYVHQATLDLINWMHIGDATITTAKIGDLAVNNAKIRNLAAGKVWIGDPANPDVLPFTDHCVYDLGNGCETLGCTQMDTGCVYKTGNCPTGQATGGCPYSPQEFAITRIFDLYGAGLSGNRDYTYINGGFIMTNSIKTNSLQVGGLEYLLDLEAYQTYDKDYAVDHDTLGAITVTWHKSGKPSANGWLNFVDGEGTRPSTGYYITRGTKIFTKASTEMPDGITVTIKIWIAYVNYINIVSGQTLSVAWQEQTLAGSDTAWTVSTGFTEMRRHGRLPLFAVVIVNKAALSKGQTFIGGVNPIAAETIINSDIGQLNVQIVWATPTPGTFIKNNDITTGIVHNPFFTSMLDMRHYTSFDDGHQYRGHGKLVIDGPSALHEPDISAGFGDVLGRAWWNYTAFYPDSYGSDTKLLIGRPYVDGLEVAYEDFPSLNTRVELEDACDRGYLWFYRTYDVDSAKWTGHLELGGTLRVKDVPNYRDVLIGLEYTAVGLAWRRTAAPGVFIYDTERMMTLAFNTPGGNAPIKLAQLGGETPVTAVDDGEDTYSAAHYFNTSSADRNYTVCIDQDSQAPADSFTEWGFASLIVIPSLSDAQGNGERGGGILIRSGVLETATTSRPFRGLDVWGAFQTGVYSYVRTDVDYDETVGVWGNAYVYITANYTTAHGVRGQARTVGENCQAYGGNFYSSCGSNGTSIGAYAYGTTSYANSEAIALQLNCSNTGGGYRAHIRFNSLFTESNRPDDSEGDVGDLIATDYNLYYKTLLFGPRWIALIQIV